MSREVYEVVLCEPNDGDWLSYEFSSYGKAERFALRNVSEDYPEVRIYSKTYVDSNIGVYLDSVQRLQVFLFPLSIQVLKEMGVI